MEKSHPIPPVQTRTTNPQTRVMDAARAGEQGSVRPAAQAIPTPASRGVAYAERIPLSGSAMAGDATAMPMTDGNATSLQRPSDVIVETEH